VSRTSKLALTRSHAAHARTSNLTCSYMYAQVYTGSNRKYVIIIPKCPVSKWVVRIKFARRCGSGTVLSIPAGIRLRSRLFSFEVIMFSSVLDPVLDGSGQPWGVTAIPQVKHHEMRS
jgi:hypothetical protein